MAREKWQEHNEIWRVMKTGLLVFNEGYGYNPHLSNTTLSTDVINKLQVRTSHMLWTSRKYVLILLYPMPANANISNIQCQTVLKKPKVNY